MTTFGLRMTGLAAIVAPLLMLASTLAYIITGEGLSSGEVAGTIQIWAFIALGVAIVGIARVLETSAPRAAALLTLLGMIGVAGGVAYGIDSIQVAFVGPGAEIGNSGVASLALRVPGLVFPLTLTTVGVLLARHHCVSPAAGYGLVVGAVLFPASRIPDIAPLAIASDVLILLAMGAIGVRMLTAPGVSADPGRSPVVPGAAPEEART